MSKIWSKTRKHLKSMLCIELRDRLDYHYIAYGSDSHEGCYRVAVFLDGKELHNKISITCCHFYRTVSSIAENIDEKDVKEKSQVSYWRLKDEIKEKAEKKANERGRFGLLDFRVAYELFSTLKIEECIKHESLLLRFLAIVDRRVGKRTLNRLNESVKSWPKWLQYFYSLRVGVKEEKT
ncbi:MAG: hypothetical protein FWD82_00095 [Defluviitaleaceae bacterium]|nr:hypothetical protein [Defluviitaleaceae bacterium]